MKKMLLTGVIIIVIFIGVVYLTNPKAEAPPPPKPAPIVNLWHPKPAPVVMHEDLPPITPSNASLGKSKGDTTPVQAGKNPWGGNALPGLGDGVHAYGSSFGQLLGTLWNPANGNLYGRTVELLQITNAEASAISDELILACFRDYDNMEYRDGKTTGNRRRRHKVCKRIIADHRRCEDDANGIGRGVAGYGRNKFA